MTYKFVAVLLAAAAVATALPHKSFRSRDNFDDVDYFDCSGKADGDYLHPTDCTRFIKCHNGRAADMACADCDQNNVAECAGNPYLVFNLTQDACDWPAKTKCGNSDVTDPPPEPTQAPTTQAPVDPSAAPSTEDAGTTEDAPAPIEEPCPFKEGDDCGAEECRHCGYCLDKVSYFLRCNKTKPHNPHEEITGVIVREECDEKSWWNPDLKPEGVELGGACDSWDGLSQKVKDQYHHDPTCNPPICEWGQDIACTSSYWYYDPKTMPVGSRLDLECQSGYIYDPSEETCRESGKVKGC